MGSGNKCFITKKVQKTEKINNIINFYTFNSIFAHWPKKKNSIFTS